MPPASGSPWRRRGPVRPPPGGSVPAARQGDRIAPAPLPADEADAAPAAGLLSAESLPLAGDAFARLRIPRIGLDAIVVQGTDRVALRKGPGHVPGTGLPGEYRDCAIAAHRDGWFVRLNEVRPGDPVWVETPDGYSYEYVVAHEQVVTPDRGDLLDRGPNPVLTLITCTGPGCPHSQYRLLVYCRLAAAAPA